jgi:hypothetical protein
MIFLADIIADFFTIMPRTLYPSNISRKQFEIIRPQLESFKKQLRNDN